MTVFRIPVVSLSILFAACGGSSSSDGGTEPTMKADGWMSGDGATTTPPFALRVLAGQSAPIVDSQGNTWAADNGGSGGMTDVVTDTITGTSDPSLYLGERYGSFTYTFTVPNGSYDLRLAFVENYVTAAGQRLFDVAVNGTTQLSAFDIFAEAGGKDIALDKDLAVDVTDGMIAIAFAPGAAQNPKVDAIQITSTSVAPTDDMGTVPPGPVVTADVVVDATKVLAPIVSQELGSNTMIADTQWTDPNLPAAVKKLSSKLLRFPGGSLSDEMHFFNPGSTTFDPTAGPYFCTPGAVGYHMDTTHSFDHFVNDLLVPGNYEGAITLNYGSSSTCTAGGDPAEAASEVAYIKSKGYNIHHYTVGNEVYGSWESDYHGYKGAPGVANDPTTYANAVAAAGTGYYDRIKAADPTAQVGVVVIQGGAGALWPTWDTIVLSKAKYDYVELHWYAQQPGACSSSVTPPSCEDDTYLATKGPQAFTTVLDQLKADLAAAGRPSTPIMLGEVGTSNFNPGQQSMSIVSALFTGMTMGEGMNGGLSLMTWFLATGGGATATSTTTDNPANVMWLPNFDYGSYDLVSMGETQGATMPAEGTVLPPGVAYQLMASFAVPGNQMIAVDVGKPNIRAYAATTSAGYAVMLFDLDGISSPKTATSTTVSLGVSSAKNGALTSATAQTYGWTQWQTLASGSFSGDVPVTNTPSAISGNTLTISLPPLSMTLVQLK